MGKVGLIHAHSTYSYDGTHTLSELAALARRHGFDFLAMTEHAEVLDAEQMRRFVAECRSLSDDGFLIVPGIEVACSGAIHILGFGVEDVTESTDPLAVAEFIRRQGGVSVLAHPSRAGYTITEELGARLDGIEIWNARYDGWFVPNDRAIALWRALRQTHSGLIAVGGQDLHTMARRGHVTHIIPGEDLSQPAVLRMLREGRSVISNSYLSLSPDALARPLRLVLLACARRMYLCARAVAKPIRDGFRRVRRLRTATRTGRANSG